MVTKCVEVAFKFLTDANQLHLRYLYFIKCLRSQDASLYNNQCENKLTTIRIALWTLRWLSNLDISLDQVPSLRMRASNVRSGHSLSVTESVNVKDQWSHRLSPSVAGDPCMNSNYYNTIVWLHCFTLHSWSFVCKEWVLTMIAYVLSSIIILWWVVTLYF